MDELKQMVEYCGSQSAAAYVLGVSTGNLSKWLNGKMPLPEYIKVSCFFFNKLPKNYKKAALK